MKLPKKCEDCKYFQRNFMDPYECIHKKAPGGAYDNVTGPSNVPPKWCPLRRYK